MSSGPVAAARLLLWIAGLAAAVGVLTELGRHALAVPPLGDAAAWLEWTTTGDATVMAFALLRTAALATAWYLLAVSLAGVAARCLRLARVGAAVDLVTVPAVRRLLQSVLCAGMATAISIGPPAVMLHSAVAASAVEEPALVDGRRPGAPPRNLPPLTPPSPAAARAQPTPDDAEWTVRPGESFWSIAERVVADAGSRPPRDRHIAAYWKRLIAANRASLPDRANPDVIYPGLTLRLPRTATHR